MSFSIIDGPIKKLFLNFEIHKEILKNSDIAYVFSRIFSYQNISLVLS